MRVRVLLPQSQMREGKLFRVGFMDRPDDFHLMAALNSEDSCLIEGKLSDQKTENRKAI